MIFQQAGENSALKIASFILRAAENGSKFDLMRFGRFLREMVQLAFHNWKSLEIIRLLVDTKYLDSSFLYRNSIECGRLDIMKYVIETKSPKLNWKILDKNNRMTPLFLASELGQLSILKYLIEERNFDLNFIHQGDFPTALTIACSKGHLQIVKYLIESGASLDITNTERDSPFFLACFWGQLEVVKFLLEQKTVKIDVNKTDIYEQTPLLIATYEGHFKIVKYLLEKSGVEKLDINKPDIHGKTPVWAACYEGDLEILKLLVKAGADINLKVDPSPLKMAISEKRTEIVKYLIELGAKE